MRYPFNIMTSIIIERNYRWSYFKSLLGSIDLLLIVNSEKITNMIRYYLKWVYHLRRFFFMTLKVTRISIYDGSYSWSYKYEIYSLKVFVNLHRSLSKWVFVEIVQNIMWPGNNSDLDEYHWVEHPWSSRYQNRINRRSCSTCQFSVDEKVTTCFESKIK